MPKPLNPTQPGKLVFFNPRSEAGPYTTSEIIAQGAEVDHHAVQQTLAQYADDFKELGVFAFEMRKPPKGSKGGRPQKIYHLSEEQATLLITYLQNTPVVRAFKKELVRQFFQMRRFISRLDVARLECPQLTDAIKAAHREPKPHHYINEMNMINRIVLGMSTKEFRRLHGLEKEDDTRPHMSTEQILAIVELQRADIGLLLAGLDYAARKARLQAYHGQRHFQLSA